MKDLPPITKRERWLYERAAPIVWCFFWMPLGLVSLIPFCKTQDYFWLGLPLLVGLLFQLCGKKLSQYDFLYKARMTKADWKRLDDEIRDNYKDSFEDLMIIGIVAAVFVIGVLIYLQYSN